MDSSICVQNEKNHRKRTGAYGGSWRRQKSLHPLTLTIPWNLAKPVKIFPRIIVRQHFSVQRQMVKERYVESRKVLLQYYCSQAWTKNGGKIPWSVTATCETSLTSCRKGKHLGSMVESHPISGRDQSRHQLFGKRALPGMFLGYALSVEGIWKGDIMVADLAGKTWARQKSMLEDSMQKK